MTYLKNEAVTQHSESRALCRTMYDQLETWSLLNIQKTA